MSKQVICEKCSKNIPIETSVCRHGVFYERVSKDSEEFIGKEIEPIFWCEECYKIIEKDRKEAKSKK